MSKARVWVKYHQTNSVTIYEVETKADDALAANDEAVAAVKKMCGSGEVVRVELRG